MKKSIVSIIVVMLVATVSSVFAQPVSGDDISGISGVVVDENGGPREGVTVIVYSAAHIEVARSVATGPDGAFEITNIVNGVWMKFYQDELPIYATGLIYEDGWYALDRTTYYVVVMSSATGYVIGYVFNNSNQPLSGVRVEFIDRERSVVASASTDSNGMYDAKPPAGRYDIRVDRSDHEEYTIKNVDVLWSSGNPQSIETVYLTPNITTYLFGMDLPHSLMAVGLVLGVVFVLLSVIHFARIRRHEDIVESEP